MIDFPLVLLISRVYYLEGYPDVRVRFPALPNFLTRSASGTGSTQPREYNWRATWKKKYQPTDLEIRKYGRRDPSRWPRGTLYPQKLILTSPTSGGQHSSSRTKATEFVLVRETRAQTCLHVSLTPCRASNGRTTIMNWIGFWRNWPWSIAEYAGICLEELRKKTLNPQSRLPVSRSRLERAPPDTSLDRKVSSILLGIGGVNVFPNLTDSGPLTLA
jgi:hypothetical protein